jgi:hypothetical protein
MNTILVLGVVVVALLVSAIMWEAGDIVKLYARRTVYDIEDFKEREKEYKFYATFNHENNIMWRSHFISAFIATVLIYFYMKNYSRGGTLELDSFAILLIIFLIYYLTHMYRNFHIYRVMASKVKSDYHILEDIGRKKKSSHRNDRNHSSHRKNMKRNLK